MKILGAGLSKTGTTSLCRALSILGFKAATTDTIRLNDIILGYNKAPNFQRYDDVDAVTDLPTALFYRELDAAYPGLLVILTVRDEDDWWASATRHFKQFDKIQNKLFENWFNEIRKMAYGSCELNETLYRKNYREHNNRVQETIPNERLLTIDITAGEGWDKLCPFLGVDPPNSDFPHENKFQRENYRSR